MIIVREMNTSRYILGIDSVRPTCRLKVREDGIESGILPESPVWWSMPIFPQLSGLQDADDVKIVLD